MEIELKRTVKTEKWELLIEYFEKEEKKIWSAIAEYIFLMKNKSLKNNEIERKKLSANLFFRNDEIYAMRNIEIMLKKGILKEVNNELRLTEEGERLRETEEVFEKKEWIFEIELLNNDPLLSTTIFEMNEIILTHEQKIRGMFHKQRDKSKNINLVKLPKGINEVKGKVMHLFNRGEIKFDNFSEVGRKKKNDKKYIVSITFREEDEPLLAIWQQEVNKNVINRSLPEKLIKIDAYEIKSKLLEDENYDYDLENDVVLLDMKQLENLFRKGNKSKLKKFLLDIEIDDPILFIEEENFGAYDRLLLKDTKIAPKNNEGANFMARELLKDKINNYMTKDAYEIICIEVNELMKSFQYQIKLPDFEKWTIEENIKKSNEKYWFIEATKDLLVGV